MKLKSRISMLIVPFVAVHSNPSDSIPPPPSEMMYGVPKVGSEPGERYASGPMGFPAIVMM
jgi:hypothetical protein